jgi:hypothetical protein
LAQRFDALLPSSHLVPRCFDILHDLGISQFQNIVGTTPLAPPEARVRPNRKPADCGGKNENQRQGRPSEKMSPARRHTIACGVNGVQEMRHARSSLIGNGDAHQVENRQSGKGSDHAAPDHPYFLNMPIWRLPGFMIGKQLGEGFGDPGRFTYWYVPPKFRDVIGLKDGDIARVIDTSPAHNLSAFARGLAKIAYCNAVMKYGLDGFRHLATRDIILGRYQNIAYFVGSDPTQPSPPYKRGQQHSVSLGSINYTHTKFLAATIRLFGDSGAGDKGMPFYTVIYGAEGSHRVVAKPRLPRLPKKILL